MNCLPGGPITHSVQTLRKTEIVALIGHWDRSTMIIFILIGTRDRLAVELQSFKMFCIIILAIIN